MTDDAGMVGVENKDWRPIELANQILFVPEEEIAQVPWGMKWWCLSPSSARKEKQKNQKNHCYCK
jgi:hypothetical protein